MRFFLILLFLTALIFTRFYNLEKTARFVWDESSNLVNIHRIYQTKDLTLIGPISEDGNKVFGSLTYYLLLPFAVLGHFDPASTAYGAAFWGTVTAVILFYLSLKINPRLKILSALLITVWWVLLIPSRWAWNPNFLPLWSSLSLLVLFSRIKWRYFLAGLFLAIGLHHHYLAGLTLIG